MWTDSIVDQAGGLQPDPEVPRTPPMPVGLEPQRRFHTTEAGEIYVHLPAADYHNAQPLVWHMLLVEVSGYFDDDCGAMRGRLAGAFLDQPEFSIPQSPDMDTDGDGRDDAFWMESSFIY